MAWEEKDGKLIYTADHEEPTEDLHTSEDFEAACVNFRQVCAEIGELIGVDDFRGGFEEIAEFQRSDKATTAAGMALAIRWMAADKLCTYEAAKLGIGQPRWWKQCWGA